MAPSNTDWVEFSEWVILFILAVAWAIYSFFSRAASILLTDGDKKVWEKNKQNRLSTTLSTISWACLLLGIALFLIWTEQADTTKTQNGGQVVNLQYWRWIGIALFVTLMSWAYANYTHMHQEDWLHLELTLILAGAGGTLSIFAHNHSRLQIGALTFTGFFYLMALFNSARYTNIKNIGIGWNWLAWLCIYFLTPFVDYILLVLGPEETRVLSEGSDAIGYIVVALFTAIVPGIIISLSFMATHPLSVPIEVYSLKKASMKAQQMAKESQIGDEKLPSSIVDLFNGGALQMKPKTPKVSKKRRSNF